MINVPGETVHVRVCVCIRDTKEQFLLADSREREREKERFASGIPHRQDHLQLSENRS